MSLSHALTLKSAGEGEGGDCSSVGEEEVGERNEGEMSHWVDWHRDRTILMLGAWDWDWWVETASSKSSWQPISWWS